MKKHIVLVALCFAWLCSGVAFAAEGKVGVKVGLGVGIGNAEYKDTGASYLPLPMVSYEGERFYVRGLSAGVHIFKNQMHEISANVSYLAQSFDASDSDDWAMRQLDDRSSSMLAGLSYILSTNYGNAKISANADVLGKSHGFLVDASYGYPVQVGDKVTVVPHGGILWNSSQYNDYYYGISSKESGKSGLKKYKADAGISPYLGFSSQVRITDSLGVFLSGRLIFLDDEIKDSPMVDKDVKYSLGTGFTYNF